MTKPVKQQVINPWEKVRSGSWDWAANTVWVAVDKRVEAPVTDQVWWPVTRALYAHCTS